MSEISEPWNINIEASRLCEKLKGSHTMIFERCVSCESIQSALESARAEGAWEERERILACKPKYAKNFYQWVRAIEEGK